MFTEGIVCASCGVRVEKVEQGATVGFADETGSLLCDERAPGLHVWLTDEDMAAQTLTSVDVTTPYGDDFHQWITELHERYAEILAKGAVGSVNITMEADDGNVLIHLIAGRGTTRDEQIKAAREKLNKARRLREHDLQQIAYYRKQYPHEFPPVIEDDPLTAALTAHYKEN